MANWRLNYINTWRVGRVVVLLTAQRERSEAAGHTVAASSLAFNSETRESFDCILC